MASIIKKKIRGQIYYYAVESRRVNGKPRIVRQKYPGKVNDIIQAVSGMENLVAPETARIYGFGREAALLAIAGRLKLAGTVMAGGVRSSAPVSANGRAAEVINGF
ncbi:MAG: hypothetical protein K6T80_07855 [Firmicutes bacterium]|nr:hypothetical protein [Bacillota bacterium]